jgi:hypothetical protein
MVVRPGMQIVASTYNATQRLRFPPRACTIGPSTIGGPPMNWKQTALSAALVAALAALPFSAAEAHWRHGWAPFWPFVAGAAVVGTAAAIATAPLRAVAPPYYYGPPPAAYYPPPAYYAPGYYGAPYYR